MNGGGSNRRRSERLQALAHPIRQRILHLLERTWFTPSEIEALVCRDLKRGRSQPTINWHINVLEAAGLIKSDRVGQNTRIFLDEQALAETCRYVRSFIPPSPQMDLPFARDTEVAA